MPIALPRIAVTTPTRNMLSISRGRASQMAAPPKGTPEYDAWRKKISESKKGHSPAPNKGKKHSEETRQKIREARAKQAPIIRKPLTDEQKAHVSEGTRRAMQAPEMRKKMSRISKGRKSTPEAIAKRTEGLRKAYAKPEVRAKFLGRSPANKGIPLSDEQRAKMSVSLKGRKAWNKGSSEQWDRMTDEQRAAQIKRLSESSKDIIVSKLEIVVAAELDAQGIIYERQKSIGWYRVDFYIPAENRVIEAHGCYWHGCELCGHNEERHLKKRLKDAKRHAYLLRKGYVLDIIWEHDRKTEIGKLRQRGQRGR